MTQRNESGHFIHACRRMAPPQSQIVLGSDNVVHVSTSRVASQSSSAANSRSGTPLRSVRENTTTTNTKQQNNNNSKTTTGGAGVPINILSVSRQARRTQLESALWAGDENLLSPTTRDKIIKQDTQMLLGGCNRRYAGRSNRSNPSELFLNPGEKSSNSNEGAGGDAKPVDIRGPGTTRGTRRVSGVNSMANSHEFVETTVGQSTAGSQLPPSAPQHPQGVKKVDHERDHIFYKVQPSVVRERTPPPPLPERKHKYHVRRVSNSPLRSNTECSEPWDRWGETQKVSRKEGPRMFPERNHQTFGMLAMTSAERDAAARQANSYASIHGTTTVTAASFKNKQQKQYSDLAPAVTATERRKEQQEADELRQSVRDLSERNRLSAVPKTGNAMSITSSRRRTSSTASSSSLGDGGVPKSSMTTSQKKVRSSSNNNSANVSGILSVTTTGSDSGNNNATNIQTSRYVPRKKIVSGSSTPVRR